ncbi:hypothetical protein Pedsa_0700 [Pseudopedobacter saltans DSM 12145]|uniref:Uncharacterized protein n=1 Tax=Pseudopedobacter saltans (strain ATCC 51119 / DSM 12145 / JCM 21818 / CCUG 39354 / LMG 10337 / NBRC 100064 / NCIMB 13643) TaxID=762903 RepID=F0S8J2_PSESL|nr:hypothetical protein [Pseudopedobacter saltans]ADY51276.1 hypothetical protein Pedsa_0700 [Pseudopedobacter saltans DSM 12145]
MKKNTLFLLSALTIASFHTKAQWVESGNQKNIVWEYSFAGTTSTVTNSGKGIEKTSTPSSQDFLPRPKSGEVKIIAGEENGTGKSSFTLNNEGRPSLTMVHTSGRGFAPAAAKFIVRNFEVKSKVMSLHFSLKPGNTAENKQAIWYFIVGSGTNSSVGGAGAPIISAAGNVDKGVYTLFRLRKAAVGGKYSLQARYNDGTQPKADNNYWGWQTISGVSLTSDKETKFDIFCNNTDESQLYTVNGTQKTLPAKAYHIYIDGVQKGAGSNEAAKLVRNEGGVDKDIYYTGDLNGFSIMSREGAHSDLKNADGTISYDNSASLMISDLKIVHLAAAKK